MDTTNEIALMQSMTDNQRLLFTTEMNGVRKERSTALLLTLFLGGFGAHRFYLGQTGLGVLYLLCSWLIVPFIVAFVELFFVGRRVDRYNRTLADGIAAKVKMLGAST